MPENIRRTAQELWTSANTIEKDVTDLHEYIASIQESDMPTEEAKTKLKQMQSLTLTELAVLALECAISGQYDNMYGKFITLLNTVGKKLPSSLRNPNNAQ